ncbi:hypothetical protein HU200_064400 [Digitaria exilis]|uniref:Protein kinase domain-containing protein n=1 Tax=Digitaria exilis TaxID=1010633 RepID=A0A835A3J3_9POAL|nr:hypothetical protein HU200_064400 [Digitaria exilis]
MSGNTKLGEPRTTQVVAGTLGYIGAAPGSDVYNFGVVLLEIACSGRPTRTGQGQPKKEASTTTLVNRVHLMYDWNTILDAMDGWLGGVFDERPDQSLRPSIAQAMDVLRYANLEIPVLPTVGQCGKIHVLEELAYGGHSAEDDGDGDDAKVFINVAKCCHDKTPIDR